MNKAVIFDLDGTLVDSLPDIVYYINYTLKHFGFPERSDKEIMQFIGNGAKKLMERSLPNALPDDKFNEILNYYNDVYTKSNSPRTKLFDGIKEVLLKLKETGYKIAILSNKPQETVDEVYKRYFKGIPFDMVVGQSETVKCKPDKTATINILSKLDVLPKNAYFVGDGEADFQTSVNSNVLPISVLWGYRSKEQLSNYGAKTFALIPNDLLTLIK